MMNLIMSIIKSNEELKIKEYNESYTYYPIFINASVDIMQKITFALKPFINEFKWVILNDAIVYRNDIIKSNIFETKISIDLTSYGYRVINFPKFKSIDDITIVMNNVPNWVSKSNFYGYMKNRDVLNLTFDV